MCALFTYVIYFTNIFFLKKQEKEQELGYVQFVLLKKAR